MSKTTMDEIDAARAEAFVERGEGLPGQVDGGAAGVERKIWLSQTGHVDPFDFRREDWVRTLHRWFDHELYGLDNGIMDEPAVDFQRPDLRIFR